jgi:hypothetical protein
VVQPPPEPVQELPEVVLLGWDAAKGRLFEQGTTCVAGKEPALIRWVFEEGEFMCGDVLANGCFHKKPNDPKPTITLNEAVLDVDLVAHEVSHFLYWACGHPLWACYLWEDNNFFHPGCK